MADGSSKNVEDVRVGDLVKSYDMTKGILVSAKVTDVYHHDTAEEMTDSYLVINNKLCVTPNHPLLINGKWIEAGKVKTGDSLLAVTQKTISPVPIRSLKTISQSVPTYNLHVDIYHTYIAGGVVVCDKRDASNSVQISTE